MSTMKYLRTGEVKDFGFINNFLVRLREKRRLVYAITAVVFFASLTVLLLIPNKYTAAAKVMPSMGTSFNGKEATSIGALVKNIPLMGVLSAKTAIESLLYKELMEGDPIIDSVLAHRYADLEEGRSGNLYQLLNIDDRHKIREKLKSMTKIKSATKTGVVTIAVESKYPKLSAQIANEYVNRLDQFKQKLDRSMAGKVGKYLEERIAEIQAKLTDSEEKQAAFLSKNRNYLRGDDPELKMEIEKLEREVFFHRQLLLTLMQYKAASDMETEKSTPRLTVIQWAQPPLVKSGPHRLKLLILATLGGILFAVGLIGLRVSYEFYFPGTTRDELASSYSSVGEDIGTVFRRIKIPSRMSKEPET